MTQHGALSKLIIEQLLRTGNNSPQIPPVTGLPAIAVPMGWNTAGLPASLQIVARPFQEATLLQVAYAYEQRTLHRT